MSRVGRRYSVEDKGCARKGYEDSMRIAYIHVSPMPGLGANTIQVAKMCEAFGRAEVNTILITPKPSLKQIRDADLFEKYSVDKVFRAIVVPRMPVPGSTLLFALCAVGYAAFHKSDLVYTRSITCAHIASSAGKSVVLELHAPVANERSTVQVRFIRLLRSTNLKLLVLISQSLRRHFLQEFGQIRQPIVVAHDGASDVATGYGAGGRHLGAGRFHVGYIGSLYPGRGMGLICRLAPVCPWATFHIIGGPEAREIYWKSQTAGVENLIFHGLVTHQEAQRYIAAMDVVLAPYQNRVEGIGGARINTAEWMSPLKIFEYMSHGKPILASDLPVLREILTGGEHAILCRADDAFSWQHALVMLRDDAVVRSNLGANAKAHFLTSYTWASRVKTILSAIRETD
jgi:glycosyltransferase involved in cell wall biosynthesis